MPAILADGTTHHCPKGTNCAHPARSMVSSGVDQELLALVPVVGHQVAPQAMLPARHFLECRLVVSTNSYLLQQTSIDRAPVPPPAEPANGPGDSE